MLHFWLTGFLYLFDVVGVFNFDGLALVGAVTWPKSPFRPAPSTNPPTTASDPLTNSGPRPSRAFNSSWFTIMTYNTFFLPAMARLVLSGWQGLKNDLNRADGLARHLVEENYDFVCLQEMFRAAPRDRLLHRLRLQGGYHTVDQFNADGWIRTSAGLSFASKWPILTHQFEVYQDVSYMTSDALAKKGIAFVLVNATAPPSSTEPTSSNPGETAGLSSASLPSTRAGALRYVCIFFTHLQAETAGRDVRLLQLRQITAFIRRTLSDLTVIPHESCVVLLAGDFNIDDDDEEYDAMISALDHPTDLSRLLYPLLDRSKSITCEGQRFDYVFCYPPRMGLKVIGSVHVHDYSVLDPLHWHENDTAWTEENQTQNSTSHLCGENEPCGGEENQSQQEQLSTISSSSPATTPGPAQDDLIQASGRKIAQLDTLKTSDNAALPTDVDVSATSETGEQQSPADGLDLEVGVTEIAERWVSDHRAVVATFSVLPIIRRTSSVGGR